MNSKQRLCRAFCLFLAVTLFATMHPVAAAPDDRSLSSPEDIAIAFFKLGNATPDFETWAKNTKAYRVAAPAMALDILERERQRLIGEWRTFDPADDVLNISGPVTVRLQTKTASDGSLQHWMHIVYEAGEVAYFPYKFMEYDFAVIPQQLESSLDYTLPKEQFDRMKKDLNETRSKALLQLQLKPVKSYLHQPYMIDGEQQWALLCDIATLSLVSKQTGQTIWAYGSDWYVSPVTEDLRDLYQKSQETAPAP